ncbi:MAG: S-layer protein [Candidatus Methanofastidiosa archaeon]|nr:S-layer protein [Candidatus Methanofastidiosa archaeon]
MKWKKIGVAVSGALLLGSTLLGAVGAATADVDKDFFINPENGEPMCLIVVGSNAAAEDVVSASWIAAQIGSMAYYETWTSNVNSYSLTYYEEEDTDNYIASSGMFEGNDYFDDFRLNESQVTPDLDTPESWAVLPFACDAITNRATLLAATTTYRPGLFDGIDAEMPIWDYDLYYDHNTVFGCDADIFVDTGCAFESLSVDFSLRDWQCSQEFCIACTAACDQMGLWWYDANDNDTIDSGEVTDFDTAFALANPDNLSLLEPIASMLSECQTYPNVYPRMYWGSPAWQEICDPIGGMAYRAVVYDMYTEVESEKIVWEAIIGPDSEAYGVCDINEPELVSLYCSYCDVYFLGEHYNALSFGTNEDGVDYMFYGTPKWYVEEKLKVGESKSYGDFTLTINDLGIYENKAFITITDNDGESHDYVVVINTYTSNVPSNGDGDYGGEYSGANEENDTIAFVEETCGTSEVVFAVKFVKTLIGAAGNYVVEYHAYSLLDCGCLTEKIYPGPCDTVTDDLYKPYVVSSCGGEDLEWYLDIIPADISETDTDGVQVLDLDNDFDLWTEGNPNFDASDVFMLYDPQRDYSMYNCVPVLELWLATPVELAGMCSEKLTICLDDLDGENYFTLEVTDNIHTDYRIDGAIKLTKVEELAPTKSTTYVDIDPTLLVALDMDVENDPDLKSQYNLVLVGGPVANSLVQELVDLGFTTFDEWDTSTGDSVLYEDVYAFGKDVLIVAGSDRAATAKAALDLIHALQS